MPPDPDPVAASFAAAPAPDWKSLSGDVACPLCEYDLRGLREPRCPECGYSFEWNDLLDPSRRRHPYLFEHHPEANAGSFIRTFVGGFNPWRFWRKLRPEQPSSLRRLTLYWLICVVLSASALVVPPLWSVVNFQQNMTQIRALRPRAPTYDFEFSPAVITASNYSAWLDFRYPDSILSTRFLQAWWEHDYAHVGVIPWRSIALLLIAAALWPWVTWASLLLLFQTRRKAKVGRSHVLRCAIYNGDGVVLLPVICFALGVWAIYRNRTAVAWMGPTYIGQILLASFGAVLALLLWAWVRLSVSLKRYLCFPHAPAVVIVSQVVAILTVATIFAVVAPMLAFVLRYFVLN